ncbi:MAG: hypothetical protein HRT71_11895 [Flavobacteriales bacterium]|nr:hypothetical protein [Flavobacteriales bacterium]
MQLNNNTNINQSNTISTDMEANSFESVVTNNTRLFHLSFMMLNGIVWGGIVYGIFFLG